MLSWFSRALRKPSTRRSCTSSLRQVGRLCVRIPVVRARGPTYFRQLRRWAFVWGEPALCRSQEACRNFVGRLRNRQGEHHLPRSPCSPGGALLILHPAEMRMEWKQFTPCSSSPPQFLFFCHALLSHPSPLFKVWSREPRIRDFLAIVEGGRLILGGCVGNMVCVCDHQIQQTYGYEKNRKLEREKANCHYLSVSLNFGFLA